MTKSLVTGIGIVSDLGSNYLDHSKNLFSLYSGIKLNKFQNNNKKLNVYVGKVLDEVNIPSEFNNTYNNLIYAISAAIQSVKMAKINFKNKRIAITFGTSLGGKIEGEEDFYKYESNNFTKNKKRAEHKGLQNIVDEIIKYFGIKASVFVISTACSASNNAVILGSQLLKSKKYDLVLAGGSDELADVSLAGFTSLGAINRNSPANPYQDGDGISIGEGAGFVVLENEKMSKGKKIYAEIIDGMISSDAYHITSPDPKGEGAEYVIDSALQKAGLSISDIDYVNGHGTGTKANDEMEYKLLSKKFDKNTIVSSTKGQTGHTLGAAGIIELINIISMINENKVVGTVNKSRKNIFNNENNIGFLKNEVLDRKINYAINLSFAFGGNNSCSIVARPGVFNKKINEYPGIDTYRLVGYNSTLSNDGKILDPSNSDEYELLEAPGSNITGYVYKNMKLTEHLNRRKYSRLDDFSKMIIKSVSKTFNDSGIDYRKIDSKEIGIMFSTPSGSIRTVEGIEKSIPDVGFDEVSASKFPYTVLNAAAGIISENFKIKGPTSVISCFGTGFIDSVEYANEFCKNYKLKYVLLINANQISKYELFSLSELGFSNDLHDTDFVSSFILSNSESNGVKLLDVMQIKGSDIDSNDLLLYIDDLLYKNKLLRSDINKIIVNGNFKTNTKNQIFISNFNNLFKVDFMNDFSFSTKGSGEELIYLLSYYKKNGCYIIVTESPFGGYSLLIVKI